MTSITKEVILSAITDTIHLYDVDTESKEKYGSGTNIDVKLGDGDMRHTDTQRNIIDVVLIPGNPGTIYFYIEFLEELAIMMRKIKKPQTIVNVHAVGHANHHLEPTYQERISLNHEKYDLDYQIQHKVAFLRDMITKSKDRTSLILIGHSIGCYMALYALKSDPTIRNHTIDMIHIMPFILWKNIPYSHRIKLRSYINLLPLSPIIMRNIGWSYIILPSFIRASIISVFGSVPKSFVRVVAHDLFSVRLIDNFFEMGKHEIIDVQKNEKDVLKLLQQLDEERMSMAFVYTHNDVWASIEDVPILQEILRFNGKKIFICDGVTHGFTLDEHGVSSMLNTIMEHFRGGCHNSSWMFRL